MDEKRSIESAEVLRHYEPEPLAARLVEAIDEAGVGTPADPRELAPWDQFHLGGIGSTEGLADALAPAPGDHVIDLGSGLGGPARVLAASRGCRVTGVDLSGEFVEAATALTERCGLEDKVDFRRGDVTALPFDQGSFDHAWTLHVAMNIADRDGFYREARRVIRPGGRFAIYDVVEGDGEPPTFPLPWATDPSTSHLVTAADTRAFLTAAGFEEVSFEDRTAATLAWFDDVSSRQTGVRGSLAVAMGPRFVEMSVNLIGALKAGRVAVLRAVLTA
jgi:sarcosine/dimethylglycine N-methyltransferase